MRIRIMNYNQKRLRDTKERCSEIAISRLQGACERGIAVILLYMQFHHSVEAIFILLRGMPDNIN
jgi:hypothetical protein